MAWVAFVRIVRTPLFVDSRRVGRSILYVYTMIVSIGV